MMDKTAPDMTGTDAGAISAPRILLVEDDAELAQMLVATLEDNGFIAFSARDTSQMDRLLALESVDLLILDIMLPGEDGLSACRRVRAQSNMPIMMVTARDDEIDRVVGLELGADDYIGKPFGSRELVARIRALLRRATAEKPTSPSILTFNGWEIDPRTRQLKDPVGVQVQLTSTEFDLLLALCRNPNRVLSREQLLELTHSGLAGPVERSVDVHISRVRQKIEPNAKDPALIKTVRLGGYIFAANVGTK